VLRCVLNACMHARACMHACLPAATHAPAPACACACADRCAFGVCVACLPVHGCACAWIAFVHWS
jgi:hypothetical protein